MSTFQLTIDLAQAEVKFYKARLALLEARAAYSAILDKEGEPFKDVQDRTRQLDASIHYVTFDPPSGPTTAPRQATRTVLANLRGMIAGLRQGRHVTTAEVEAIEHELTLALDE